MLDIPFASQDEVRLTYDPPVGRVWHPKHILTPVWHLDARVCMLKRVLDVALAIGGLVLASPFMLCIALAIWRESRGPILFRQRRVGQHGDPFTLFKFRTMHASADSTGPLRQATRHDSRVTRLGRWLRRHSLDELPQLLNVLRGEMSIVGPRPHAPGTRAGGKLFEDVSPRYGARHCVKPGLTGLAQVRGWRGETDTEEKLLRRIECDLEYIAGWSVALDLKIIGKTAISVFHMRNAY